MPVPVLLIVDDEELVRNLLKVMLSADYELILAESGYRALELCKARTTPIDLALLDLVMPGMHGPELLSCLRELYPEVKAIFMSGYPEEQARKLAGLEFDEGRFIPKPFTPKHVRELLSAQLRSLNRVSMAG